MIERAALFGLLFAIPATAAFTPPAPAPFAAGDELDFRVFLKEGALTGMAEGVQRLDTDGRQERAITLGSYYRPWEPLNVGLFYRRVYGLRHDDDWINPGTGWNWAATNGRGEDLVIVDATPKLFFDFLPGDTWIGELKTRFIRDFFNHEDTLSVRPGLTYFWLRDEQPFLNFFLQYELDFPLNYGSTRLNQQWIYLGSVYSLTKILQLAAFVSYHTETWSTSASFLANSGRNYVVEDRSLVLGAGLLFPF